MKKIILFLFCFCAITLLAFAQKKPAAKSEATIYNELLLYANTLKVIDAHEHLLSAEEKSTIEQTIYDLENETHHQIGIAIIQDLQ